MANTKATGIPTEAEVVAAVEMAGYPLEIRLYERLEAAGVFTSFGQRFRINAESTETKEIDLLAMWGAVLKDGADEAGDAQLSLEAFIQLKRIHEGGFVGFVGGRPPNEHDLRAERTAIVAGIPSVGVLQGSEYNEHLNEVASKDGLGGALDVLNAGPYCIQWGIARRVDKNTGAVRIDQEHSAWEDIANTIRAITAKAHEESGPSLLSDGLPSVDLRFRTPTLVVDAPLWTYEAKTKSLSPVEAFMVRVTVDTSWGPATALVDVVSAAHFDAFIERYKIASNSLAGRLKKVAPRLLQASAKVRTLYRKIWSR